METKKVKLLTARREYVATVEIPAFNRNPDVLLWGSRYFAWVPGDDIYREAFFWVVVDQTPRENE